MYSLMMTANGHVDLRGTLAPPIIMRTAATPMPTPKSSLGAESSSQGRRSPLAPHGSGGSWGSRRSSWNSLSRAPSLKRRDPSGERESLLSGHAGGARRKRAREHTHNNRFNWTPDNPFRPEELTDVLEISNIVFTSMFVLEMVFKLLAFGLFGYIRNPYNIFDSIIVIISRYATSDPLCVQLKAIVGQADGGLSVLRTFRLLRVLKLVRFLPALRRQLVVLMKTMDNVATFCMLLMLFIFTFSILGMHLFGCKFSLQTENGDTVPDRKNFDSLLWAIVTVFQILTQEDWNVVLYNGMASTSPLAALYFVALMTWRAEEACQEHTHNNRFNWTPDNPFRVQMMY
ncbi:hypothetical protein CRUP_014712 [Coryphaenoides rupestris]|nr:hypothetical protein CRUP_014712 [Coryphaenoides rupestris]